MGNLVHFDEAPIGEIKSGTLLGKIGGDPQIRPTSLVLLVS